MYYVLCTCTVYIVTVKFNVHMYYVRTENGTQPWRTGGRTEKLALPFAAFVQVCRGTSRKDVRRRGGADARTHMRARAGVYCIYIYVRRDDEPAKWAVHPFQYFSVEWSGDRIC